jgi:NADH-quinone oxidoreductase subunit K
MVSTAAVPLSWYLILGAGLFCIGLYGLLANRNLIAIMMSIELMLNAVVLNLVAFARFIEPARIIGKTFGLIVYATAAAEAALGLALIISIWRTEGTVAIEEMDLLQG